MTNEATPTPWHVEIRSDDGEIVGGDDSWVATVGTSAVDEANADLIVRAVNAYQPMLDALREAEAELDTLVEFEYRRGPDESGVNGTTESRLETVRAAIAAADGREAVDA